MHIYPVGNNQLNDHTSFSWTLGQTRTNCVAPTHPPIQIDKSKLYFFKNEIERAANFKNLNRAVSDRIQNNAFFIRSILDFKIGKNVIYFSLRNFVIKIFTIFLFIWRFVICQIAMPQNLIDFFNSTRAEKWRKLCRNTFIRRNHDSPNIIIR